MVRLPSGRECRRRRARRRSAELLDQVNGFGHRCGGAAAAPPPARRTDRGLRPRRLRIASSEEECTDPARDTGEPAGRAEPRAARRPGRRRYRRPVASSPCDPRGCEQFFGRGFARRRAASYRRHGLDSTAQRMVEFLGRRNVQGASVLEVGGGVGEIQVELLKRGAATAVNLELSAAYEEEALELLRAAGLEGRVERRLQDVALDAGAVEPADVVVLHRVVCCYPDYQRLLAAA